MERQPASYSVYWAQDRADGFADAARRGRHLDLMFGGPHNSQPKFGSRVKHGDWIYALGVREKRLHVYARMRISEVLTLKDYFRINPLSFPGCVPEDLGSVWLSAWRSANPDIANLLWNCTDQVVQGERGSRFTLDAFLGTKALAAFRVLVGKKEYVLRIKEDCVLSAFVLRGIRQISDATAKSLEACLKSAGALGSRKSSRH